MAEQFKPTDPDVAKMITRRQVLEVGASLGAMASALVAVGAMGSVVYRGIESYATGRQSADHEDKQLRDSGFALGGALGAELFNSVRKTVKQNILYIQAVAEKFQATEGRDVSRETNAPEK